MAMVTCPECKQSISSKAKMCPLCGAPVPKRTSTATIIFGAIFLFAVGSCVTSIITTPSPPPVVKSPEQVAKDKKSEAAFQKVVAAAAAVKRSMREPDSIKWETINANDDASVICMEYRAKNGFGGVSKELVVIANGAASQKIPAWNKHCTTSMNNMIHVRQAVP